MKKVDKFNEFSMLRAIGALSVVAIHVSSVFVGFNNTSFSYLAFGIVNKFLNFAVPLFLFLSALLLTNSYKNKDDFSTLNFYKKRIVKTAPAFLIYIAIYYFYLRFCNFSLISPILEPLRFFTTYILQGQIYYHLYFMPIIFELYFLFPFIFYGIKKIRSIRININPLLRFILVFVFMILLQFIFQKIHKYYIWPYFKNPAIIVFTYLIPIGLGIWIGKNYDDFKKSKSIKIFSFMLSCVTGYFFIRYSLYPKITLNDLVFPIYTSSISIVLLSISILIMEKTKFLKNILNEISKHSLTIYLIHPLFLDIFKNIYTVANQDFLGNLVYAIIKFTVVFGASYLFSLLLSFIKFNLTNRKI